MRGPRIPIGLPLVTVPAGGEATTEALCAVDGFVSTRMVVAPPDVELDIVRVEVDGEAVSGCAVGPCSAFSPAGVPPRTVLCLRLGQRVSVTVRNRSTEDARVSACFIGNVYSAAEYETFLRERVPA